MSRERESYKEELHSILESSPIAMETDRANEQHYELPSQFFQLILGDYMKYSSCYWDETNHNDLSSAEREMLAQTIAHAQIEDDQKILDLGCGWGSLSIYIAEHFPTCEITAMSNSLSQGEYIRNRAKEMGLTNIEVITANIAEFEMEKRFDRIVSVEMFEHMRNYSKLFVKLSGMLNTTGKVFVHVFARHGVSYLFDHGSTRDFMAKYFFAGGTMPNVDLIPSMAGGFVLEEDWTYNGLHYAKTLETWLRRMKQEKEEILPVLAQVYGSNKQNKWWNYWKIFFIVCAELFAFDDGDEWVVKHYRLVKK